MDDEKKIKTTELIEELLHREDPALIGVKKILRKHKGSVGTNTPYAAHTPEVFNAPTAEKSEENTTLFTDTELDVVSLEKELLEMRALLEEKEQEKQLAVEEAYAAGVEEGRRVQEEVSRETFQAELQEVAQERDTTMMELIHRDLQERENYFHSLQEDLVALVFAITEKVISRSVEQDRSIVQDIVKRALFYVADKRGIDIRVNPEDKEIVEELVSSFQNDGERFTTVSVIADSGIVIGGCIIESPAGIVDAQLTRQLSEIENEVSRAWSELTANAGEIDDRFEY